MLKTIIFDLGGVIVPLDFPRGYAAMAECCPFAVEEIRTRIAETGLVPLLECGKIEPEAFMSGLSETLQLNVSPAEFRRIWSSIFPPYTLIPESLVAGLRKNYRVLLLSNTNALHFEMILENYPILRHFDEYILSYKVGAMKPDPAIYQAVIGRSGCTPQECFFTDDIQLYVDGAKQAGIDAVQFQGHDRLVQELLARGVIIA